MIDVVGVTQHYGVRPVLRGVNLHVNRGEIVTLLGPNGMGKSTLLGVIAGVISPLDGYVEINSLRRRRTEDEELAIRKQVVYLPDQPWLPAARTGREFLVAVGELYEVPFGRLFDHIDRLLRLFELETVGDWPMRSYSAGQQKKIALCSALVTECPVMLLDEPFSGGLDPSGVVALKAVLQGLSQRSGVTIVMATPVPELVEEISHRVAVLRDGQILACETLDGLRRLAGGGASLAEILQRLMHPQTLENLQRYFQEPAQ